MGLIIALVLSTQPSVSAYCAKGMRGDPVVRISDGDRHYSVYFMPDHWDDCKKYAAQFQSREINSVCGCKQLKVYGEKDRLRLSCATLSNGKLYVKRVATYFYYRSSIPYCKRLRNILMLSKKHRWR